MTERAARLWRPRLRINRVPRVMLQTRWSAEAWSVVRVEFRHSRLSESRCTRCLNLAQKRSPRRPSQFNLRSLVCRSPSHQARPVYSRCSSNSETNLVTSLRPAEKARDLYTTGRRGKR